jgi:uncharacterized DUF497 family protein
VCFNQNPGAGDGIPGRDSGVIVAVVYAERDDPTRIISARKATRHEENEYHRSQTAE